jgi:hypothetical protein
MIFYDYEQKTIRLSDERWKHINDRHPETNGQEELIKETLSSPDFLQEGGKGDLLAIKKFKKTPITDNKYCTVVYKPLEEDGFIITAYFTRRPSFRRNLIWKK